MSDEQTATPTSMMEISAYDPVARADPHPRMKAMREGDHRCDPDATAHQQAFAGVFDKLEMVDRLRHKNFAPLTEDAMQHFRAAAPVILAQHTDLITRSIRRVAGHADLASGQLD